MNIHIYAHIIKYIDMCRPITAPATSVAPLFFATRTNAAVVARFPQYVAVTDRHVLR